MIKKTTSGVCICFIYGHDFEKSGHVRLWRVPWECALFPLSLSVSSFSSISIPSPFECYSKQASRCVAPGRFHGLESRENGGERSERGCQIRLFVGECQSGLVKVAKRRSFPSVLFRVAFSSALPLVVAVSFILSIRVPVCADAIRVSVAHFVALRYFVKDPEKKKKKRETKRRTKTTQNDFLSGIFIVLSAHLTPFKGLVGKCLRLRVLLVEPRNFGAVVWRNVCDRRGASLGRKLVVFYLSVQRLSGSAFARSRWVRSAQPAGCFFIRYGRSRSNSVRPIPTGVKSWS